MQNENDDVFIQLQSLMFAPLVQDYIHHVSKSAGYQPPPSVRAIFTEYHRHFFEPPTPLFNRVWGESSPNWKWQKKHSDSIAGSVQSALACVHYHSENLVRIEKEILAFPKIEQLKSTVGTACIGGGNTQKLDFEYHAFIFSFRRTLDYLARGVAALLKQDFHSFRKLPDSLKSHLNHDWVAEIVRIHAAHCQKLDCVLSNQNSKSTRDIIAHYSHVPAGCLNVNAKGVFLAGGGENLRAEKTLSDTIYFYVQTLESIVRETLEAIMRGFPRDA